MALRPKRSMRPARRIARRADPLLAFDALQIEGSLIQPDLLARIATQKADGQDDAGYGRDGREHLREVVQKKFTLGQSIYARFRGSNQDQAATERLLYGLFGQVFEFTDVQRTPPIELDERSYPIGRQALAGRVPIVYAPFEAIDRPDRAFGEGGRMRTPAQLLQDYLNAAEGSLWGLVADGACLRLYRDNATLTRPAYIEADLGRIFDPEAPGIADFSALWLLIHASRFGQPGTPPADCALERWRTSGREQGATARELLRRNVEAALLELGRGFLEHPGNTALRAELADGRLSREAYLQSLLRLIYRLIFICTAEDRDLLHLPPPAEPEALAQHQAARRLYMQGYGLVRLRERAVKQALRDRHGDAFEGLKILFRALATSEPRLALPALGGLFAPGGARELTDCALANVRLYEAIFRLAWLHTEAGLERVNWRDMATEELGSVYESLLEISPHLGGPENFDFIEAKGHERKTTASYYTPDSLVEALLKETLDPLIEATVAGKDSLAAIEALLALRIIDPACGSGHFLLGAARRLARRLSQLAEAETARPAPYRHWLREAARRCLFGVDRNPMAIELAKVALWIETVEPGRPLSFLDAHLRCGDSLLGVYDLAALEAGIPDAAYKPLTGDDKPAAKVWLAKNKAERDAVARGELALGRLPRSLYDAARAIEAQHDDALADVEAKQQAYQALLAGPERQRLQVACDLYVAAFLLPKRPLQAGGLQPRLADGARALIPTTKDVWDKLLGHTIGQIEAPADDAAYRARAFHWPVEFPQVFANGGFQLVLGNPPWEVSQLGEEEYFASRAPEIAQLAGKKRKDAISALKDAEPRLWEEYVTDKRTFDAANEFARASARFEFTAVGKINTYALFAEVFSQLAPRAGVIVPTGVATDATTAPFFAHLVEQRRLAALIDFENREKLFPAVDSRMKFALVALAQQVATSRFSFFLTQSDQAADEARRFTLTTKEIARLNPNTRTAPVFRSRADAELTKQIYDRVPVLIDETAGPDGNPWGIEFRQGLFNMTSDSGLFVDSAALRRRASGDRAGLAELAAAQGLLPLYEAKLIHQFDHRWATYDEAGGTSRDLTDAEKADPAREPLPRYWVPQVEVEARLAAKGWRRGWLMGWRDICRATDERTVIASAIPRFGSGDKFLLMFPGNIDLAPALLAVLDSLVFDFVARQKLGGTSLKYFIMKQLVAPPLSAFTVTDLSFIAPRVLEVIYTSPAMRPFALDLGYDGPPFAWDEDRRALLRAELDAWIARLYGLERDQLRFILDPVDIYGPDYPSETFRVLKKKELKRHGDYRTARLVLAAFDRLASGELAA